MNRKGFTLLELLIVIAILAVLATVTVMVINPAEYLRQSRDAKRIDDMVALNKALGFAEFSELPLGGVSTTVFISLVDTAGVTCPTLLPTLPPLPTTHQYRCVTTEANLRKTDGNGWVPVNLASMTGGSPLASLPTDPVNDTTNFYTYIPGGSFALSATLESDKFMKQNGVNDGGINPAKIEKGSDLKLLAKAEGLLGYWPLYEGIGTVASDASGNGNNGTAGAIGWTPGGCVSGGCRTAVTGNGEISIPSNATLDLHSNVTIANWVKINTAMPASTWPSSFGSNTTHIGYGFRSASNGTNWMFEYGKDYPTCGGSVYGNAGGINMGIDVWHFLVMTYDGTSIKIYGDGVLKYTTAFNTGFCTSFPMKIMSVPLSPGSFMVDEPRIYNRVLSAPEIQAMYNANK